MSFFGVSGCFWLWTFPLPTTSGRHDLVKLELQVWALGENHAWNGMENHNELLTTEALGFGRFMTPKGRSRRSRVTTTYQIGILGMGALGTGERGARNLQQTEKHFWGTVPPLFKIQRTRCERTPLGACKRPTNWPLAPAGQRQEHQRPQQRQERLRTVRNCHQY
jgi:hypothetical protein